MESLATRMALRIKNDQKQKSTASSASVSPHHSSSLHSQSTSSNPVITEVEGNICPICYQLVWHYSFF